MPFATGVPHTATVSPIDQYLLGSSKPLAAGFEPIATDFSGVTGQVFSERLTTILNTVWQASLATGSIPLGAAANYSAGIGSESFFPSGSRTTKFTQEIPVYDANHSFTIILLLVALILQVCAIAGLILKYTATAPDILGYISTMAMDNPHINVPYGGNTLDGLEHARYLQNVKVQLADITGTKSKVISPLGVLTMRLISRRVNFPRVNCMSDGLFVLKARKNEFASDGTNTCPETRPK